MRKNRLFIIVVLLLGGGFLMFGIFTGRFPEVIRNYFSASLSTQTPENQNDTGFTDEIYDLKYSFSEDDDNDGLSNAKEIIYGADPQTQDTDGDGHHDGEEVKNGYDPTRSGAVTLENRFEENLTIHYFEWAKRKTGNNDPRLEERLVNEFIATQIDLSPPLLNVSDSELSIIEDDSYEAVLVYFRELENTPLPTVASSYYDVSQEAVLGNLDNVEKISNQLTVINGQLRTTPTPRVAATLQKKYIQLVSRLKILFQDLYFAQVDPIKLTANLERGKQLIGLIKEIALETNLVVTQYQEPLDEKAPETTP